MRNLSLARRLFLLLVFAVVLFTAFIATAFFLDARDQLHQAAGKRTLAVSQAIADSPFVVDAALHAADTTPSGALEPYAVKTQADTGVDFVTIMAPDGTRWTHPNPAEIGAKYIGSTSQALAGQPFTETTTGTLGPSVRTIVPIKTPGTGKVIGMVASGVSVTNLDVALSSRIPAVVGVGVVVLLLGSLGAALLERHLSAATHGYGLEQLSQLFAYYESVLHSVREGVVMVSTGQRLVIRNDQASELLGLPRVDGSAPAPRLADLDLPDSLLDLLTSGRRAQDEIHLAKDRVLVVTQEPATMPSGRRTRPLGTVVTLRDRTEVLALGTELATLKTLSDALRAQTHEHANRLHLLVSLMELGRTQEALDLATRDLELGQRLADELVDSVGEPVLTALVMGKSAEAHERGVQLDLDASAIPSALELPVQDLVTIVGNLLDNAIDAAAAGPFPRRIELGVSATPDSVILTVQDSGDGFAPGELERAFEYGYSTKASSHGRGVGLALVRQTVRRLGGTLEAEPGRASSRLGKPPAARAETHAKNDDGSLAGARFTVTLPLSVECAGVEQAGVERAPDGPAGGTQQGEQ